jgi:hypothetical protein
VGADGKAWPQPAACFARAGARPAPFRVIELLRFQRQGEQGSPLPGFRGIDGGIGRRAKHPGALGSGLTAGTHLLPQATEDLLRDVVRLCAMRAPS